MQSNTELLHANAEPCYAMLRGSRCVIYSEQKIPLFVFEAQGALAACSLNFDHQEYLGNVGLEDLVLCYERAEIGSYPFTEFRAKVEKQIPFASALTELLASTDSDKTLEVRRGHIEKLEGMLTDSVMQEMKKGVWNLPIHLVDFSLYVKGSRAREIVEMLTLRSREVIGSRN